MPRQLRIQYEGAIYHLLNRGDRREEIFRDDLDRKSFLQTLGAACEKTGWQVHAYCLMGNHFHLVIETPRANLVAGMKWLLGTYTIRFNRRHKLSGHLFAGRYKSLLIDERALDYLRTVCDYVHLNPVRAGLVKRREPLEKYAWSSYPSYLQSARRRPSWLRCDRLLGEHGLANETRRARLEFRRRMEQRRVDANDPAAEAIRRGWFIGSEEFIARLLDRLDRPVSEHHHSRERTQTDEQKAEAIIRAALAKIGWGNSELKRHRKSNPHKVRLAQQLRARTSVSLKWIAQRLEMGSWTHVSNLLQRNALECQK
jgi:REP element-mobilizing transposase RayT